MQKKPRRIPRVALLVETTRTYTRELLGGVRRYIAEHGPWSTFIELRALDSSPPPWLKHWDGHGIISRTFTQETADIIAASGVPAVEIRSSKLCQNLPFVGMDNRLIGCTVAEHFFNRGYRNFAAYSLETETFFEQRVQNFVSTVKAEGCLCTVLPETEPRVEMKSAVAGDATGPFTVNITFNLDVGNSFTLADLKLTGATASALTKLSATTYTVLLTPPTGTAGLAIVELLQGSVTAVSSGVANSRSWGFVFWYRT
jgi:hypothetical protein